MTNTELSAAPKKTGPASVTHAVHVNCQEDEPHVVALCGEVLDWDDEVPATAEVCVVCFDLKRCPVCRMSLVRFFS